MSATSEQKKNNGSGYFGQVYEARQYTIALEQAAQAKAEEEREIAEQTLKEKFTTEYYTAMVFGYCSQRVVEVMQHESQDVVDMFTALCIQANVPAQAPEYIH